MLPCFPCTHRQQSGRSRQGHVTESFVVPKPDTVILEACFWNTIVVRAFQAKQFFQESPRRQDDKPEAALCWIELRTEGNAVKTRYVFTWVCESLGTTCPNTNFCSRAAPGGRVLHVRMWTPIFQDATRLSEGRVWILRKRLGTPIDTL